MKKVKKIIGYGFLGLLVITILAVLFFFIKWNLTSSTNMKLLGKEAPGIVVNGVSFRDLNKNGKLDPYEDHRAAINNRITDLTNQMTLEEKAGLLFITMIGMNDDGSFQERPIPSDPITFFLETNSTMVAKKKMNHFNIIQSASPKSMALWNNNIQKMAERTRLGIPVTIATDPRHSAHENAGASIPTPFFSKWPSPLGFAATRDTLLMREFGDIARQEYKALGIRLALSPQADLATEPRWGRINGTFGEDAELSAKMTKAFVLGFQGDSLDTNSVACMTKHFSGGGPQEDGEDAHFPYGANQVYPGDNFGYHLIPFEKGAFPANTAQIMPYYGVPVGQTNEDVGFGYNKEIITGMLRNKYGFDGVVCADWGLISDSAAKPAAAHGVEHLSEVERAAKILEAGCDMFGGEASPTWVIELVKSGKLSEERLNTSVKRVLKDKFRMGLFDNPYVANENLNVFENEAFKQKGKEAQRKSLVLLKNEENILPLKKGVKIYVEGIDEEIAAQFSTLYLLERFFHQGRLNFNEDELAEHLELIKTKPTTTIMNLERPAVFPEINAATQGLIADFDCSDQKEDVPYDSKDPLYNFGAGITF